MFSIISAKDDMGRLLQGKNEAGILPGERAVRTNAGQSVAQLPFIQGRFRRMAWSEAIPIDPSTDSMGIAQAPPILRSRQPARIGR